MGVLNSDNVVDPAGVLCTLQRWVRETLNPRPAWYRRRQSSVRSNRPPLSALDAQNTRARLELRRGQCFSRPDKAASTTSAHITLHEAADVEHFFNQYPTIRAIPD